MVRGLLSGLLFLPWLLSAQLKYLVEDFEGMYAGNACLTTCGIFTFGGMSASLDGRLCTQQAYSGMQALRIDYKNRSTFGGWGKGVSLHIQLNPSTDFVNFYVHQKTGQSCTIRFELHEDDDSDNSFNKDRDDLWSCSRSITGSGKWELISIPLSEFRDGNEGGDGRFNVSYREGKLFVLLMSFENMRSLAANASWYFDFVSFSKGPLKTLRTFDPPHAAPSDYCALGAWTTEGNSANFVDIAKAFEGHFRTNKKLGVIHFFQSFSVGGDGGEYHYPSVERINKVIDAGYLPMITLEDHFVNTKSHTRQPNLYSIVEGHFDSFFGYWAHHIKQVKGTVLLRILHEFNGDWYPWCTVKNDKNPELVGRAFRYIVNIFRQNNVTNVKFVWCPNSMSVPQESWNYIMDAYPGDEYVDFVGLDVYNGAGTGKNVSIWRSFRQEAMENYFILSDQKPSKPLLICETASRERDAGEPGQTKADWIRDMSVALKGDMSRIRLLAWFSEKQSFMINTSPAALKAFEDHVMKDPYFINGKGGFETLVK